MHSFHYHNGELHCEDVSLQTIADTYGTPTYVYSANTFRDHYTRLDAALSEVDHAIEYAVKANSNISVLRLLAELGSGFDIVSGGELYRVIKAGGDPAKCTFAGVGKTREEIEYALKQGIYCFNAESEAEVVFIDKVAGELGLVAPVALRVNPNVDAKTHKYISTGKSENKFGIDFEFIRDAYGRAAKLQNIKLRGLQMHIGSQLTSVTPFIEAVEKVAPLAADLKGLYDIEFFSIGGGVGIVYDESLDSGKPEWWANQLEDKRPLTIEQYCAGILPHLKGLGLKILVEPGRYIAGNAGVMLTRCLYEKKGTAKTFKVVDAGMNDLIRPALYEGHHDIAPVREPADDTTETVDVVGPICETGDFFCQNRPLPNFDEGDVIALLSAGAYGYVMASNYNTRGLPAEILVDGSESKVVRPRQTVEDIVAAELV
ncbi:diaminopimelate decarboxylase [Rubritalea squalenifaciens DSM 18772]|uniref:Diaminopimelate decarboxylase n=1 Tax=Rubritalea squalenifaciens DSM 18772 TaxID=1123071 RepID=A0A1M6IFN3_9BACT|nr:diaminopimelate decarboxylase [Rubritalea squalenifaciens]SHJ33260.1 diaminopimelate decarboxylase [Rubritalea squalenifaciens DSM 18772]